MARGGVTLVELVLVIGLVGVLIVTVLPLAWQGTRTFLFLPRSQVAAHVAMEALQAVIEGSYSELPSQEAIRGLRYSARGSAPVAVWYATNSDVAYMTSTNERVLIRLDAASKQLKRGLLASLACPPTAPAQEELLPYYAIGSVTLQTPTPLFRYYDATGGAITPTADGCRTATDPIRRIDIVFTAQTGSGSFDQSDARVPVMSSVAIRFP